MVQVFIDNHLKVTGWDVSLERRSLIIHVNPPILTNSVKQCILDDGFALKEEFHITCVGRLVGEGLSDKQLNFIEKAMMTAAIDQVLLKEELYRVALVKIVEEQSYERESIVAPITSPAIANLLSELSRQLSVAIEPYLHVTIATRPNNIYAKRGIGINSQQEFNDINQGKYLD